MELAKMNYEAWAVEKRQALAEKDRQLAAANARNEMLKAENNRLCVEGHEYQAIAENANASLAKEIATLKEQVRVLTASAKGDRVCMWCRQVLEPVPGNEIETAARLADHLLHCKDHPLAKLLNTQGLWVGELQEEIATLKTLLRDRIHDALSQPPSAPTLGELHAAEQEGKDVTI